MDIIVSHLNPGQIFATNSLHFHFNPRNKVCNHSIKIVKTCSPIGGSKCFIATIATIVVEVRCCDSACWFNVGASHISIALPPFR